jgi:hypothetical protein
MISFSSGVKKAPEGALSLLVINKYLIDTVLILAVHTSRYR